ncbi:MAG: HAMP domain-containing sensor histidine kinase [Bacteroidota bacterium]
MKAYRTSVKIKLGLIVAAVLIAVASLWYTNDLANRLMRQEQEAIQLWARAIEYQTQVDSENPYQDAFAQLEGLLRGPAAEPLPRRSLDSLRAALQWARSMPASDEINFVFNEIVQPERFYVPAIITDTTLSLVVTSRNVDVDSSRTQEQIDADLLREAAAFDAIHPPIRLDLGDGLDVQLIHYGESDTVRTLRWFPFVQFLFVGLFILVGYLGFSYVRRSEQSSLWVGMAKEAAHQLGTPISSIMGWTELLRAGNGVPNAQVADELDKDVGRLHRVADRFQKIGSVPALEAQPLAPVTESIADYVRRRLPSAGRRVELEVDVPPGLWVSANRELFEWVVENLLKNALDALEGEAGTITVRGYRTPGRAGTVTLDVRDTGKGIERSAARHVFRPGFSTKQRGWGLGLSLAKRIVEDYHGGTLTLAETRPGQGTTFRIVLAEAEPVADAAAEPHPEAFSPRPVS